MGRRLRLKRTLNRSTCVDVESTVKPKLASGVQTAEYTLAIDLDDESRRLVYAVVGGRLTVHSASVQVSAEGKGTRIVWIADFLPNELQPYIAGQMDLAVKAMKQTLED